MRVGRVEGVAAPSGSGRLGSHMRSKDRCGCRVAVDTGGVAGAVGGTGRRANAGSAPPAGEGF